jgi:hypothetical protein|tara:strand:- start:1289 stop:2068 length:780 start_codon:yes stop_codon:yes gene_type:complete
LCTGAVGALSNFIERAGVACTSISLVREQSEAVGPTRALWVPFALGRPLGSAEDPDFQKRVMRDAFALLVTATEPTIADYDGPLPEEAGPGQWACPLNLGPVIDDTLTGRLLAEVGRLKTWSSQTRAARRRTLFGVSGAGPDQIDDVARALASIVDAESITDLPDLAGADDIEWAFDMPLLVRHLADDLRTFYHEAIAAQPGSATPNHDALNDWIFGGTALGDTLQAVADRLTQADDPMAALVRGLLIPEGRYKGGSAF